MKECGMVEERLRNGCGASVDCKSFVFRLGEEERLCTGRRPGGDMVGADVDGVKGGRGLCEEWMWTR